MSTDDVGEEFPGAAGQEVPEFNIGDQVLIKGGQLDRTRGRIYYMDENLLRILPNGASDRVIDIPLEEGGFSESLGIKRFFQVSKAPYPTFVSLIDAQVGQIAETFSATGEPGIKYKVVEINEADDTMVLEDETGGRKELQFQSETHAGIALDEPFTVIRTRFEAGPEEEGAEGAEDAEGAEGAEGAEDADVSNIGSIDFLEEEGGEEGKEEETFGIQLLSEEERTYPDALQRNEMIRDLLELLDVNIRKMPRRQKEIRQLSEQMILLRNEIVKYNSNGDPDGVRTTSFQTLGELLTKSDIPIARPVLDVKKNLFVAKDPRDPTQFKPAHGLQIDDQVKTIIDENGYLNTNLGVAATDKYAAGTLPAWYITWQGIFQKYMRAFIKGDSSLGAPIVFAGNKEFFRHPLPKTAAVLAPGLRADPESKKYTNSYLVKDVRASIMKGLGSRETRMKSVPVRIESGEEAVLVNQMIFPLSTERELGSTRSGSLAKDIAVSHQPFRTIHSIMEELDYIPDEPSAGGIIAVGVGGNTDGNIGLEDWLKGQPLALKGLGDARIQSSSLGITQYELNSDQQNVLIEKINSFRAAIKHYIKENTEESNRQIQAQRLETQSFLQEQFREELLVSLRAEPLLADMIEELGQKTPAYKDNDIAIIAAISADMADYMLATFSGNPDAIARERTRTVADTFLRTLRSAMKKKQNADMQGEVPTPNTCVHVKDLERIKRIENEQEKMGLLSRLLTTYKKERVDNWIMCNVCDRTLLCYHEELQLLAFRHPHDRERIHKELMLGFSRGQSGGHYLCKNCGQTMAEIDYDRGMEFNEDGIPLAAAAAPLEGEEMTAAEKAFNEVIGIEDGEIQGSDEEGEDAMKLNTAQRIYYNTAARIYNMLGIYPEPSALKAIIQRVGSEIQRQPSPDQYARMAKAATAQGKKVYDYSIRMKQVLIGITAAHVLIEIQCHIPDYTAKYTIPGCVAGFTGYPLGQPEDTTFIKYMICGLSDIKDEKDPWNASGFQALSEATRRDALEKVLMQALGEAIKLSAVQILLKDKRAYYEKKYGSLEGAGSLIETVPKDFRPFPYAIKAEEAAQAAIVPAAAGEKEKAQAWIQEGHKLALLNGTYSRGSPFSEASCCKTNVTEPRGFWKEKEVGLPQLAPKESPLGAHDSQLMFPYTARPIQHITAETPADLMYRVFLQVCYDGPRKGLPHEPGYTNLCPHCGFQFPDTPFTEMPAPPLSSDAARSKEMMKEWKAELDAVISRGKSALESNGVRVSDPAVFQDILDATHRSYAIKQNVVPRPTTGMELLGKLQILNPQPFQGWNTKMNELVARVETLPPQPDITSIEEAYGPMSNKYVDSLNYINQRIKTKEGPDYRELLANLLDNSPPVQIAEIMRTYFLFMIKRICESYKEGFVGSGLIAAIIPTSLDLPKDVADDIISEFTTRTVFPIYKMASSIKSSSTARVKLEHAYRQLSAIIPIIQREMRANFVPGGETGMRYLIKTMVAGVLADLLDPNIITLTGAEAARVGVAGGQVDATNEIIKNIVIFCFQRLSAEGLRYTQERIKELLAKRVEAEKMAVFRRWEAMTPEEKAMHKRNQKIGLKEFAVGGTKAIYRLDADQYERERQERAAMGIPGFRFTGAEMGTLENIERYGGAGPDAGDYGAQHGGDDQ